MTVQHQSYLELKNRERFFPRRIPKDIKSRSSMEGSGNSSPGKFNVFSHFFLFLIMLQYRSFDSQE